MVPVGRSVNAGTYVYAILTPTTHCVRHRERRLAPMPKTTDGVVPWRERRRCLSAKTIIARFPPQEPYRMTNLTKFVP